MKKRKTTFWIVISMIGVFFCLPITAEAQENTGTVFCCSGGFNDDGQFSHWIGADSTINMLGEDILSSLGGVLPDIVEQDGWGANFSALIIEPPASNYDPVVVNPFVQPFNVQNVINPSDYISLEPEPTEPLPGTIFPIGSFKVGELPEQNSFFPGPTAHGTFHIGLTQ